MGMHTRPATHPGRAPPQSSGAALRMYPDLPKMETTRTSRIPFGGFTHEREEVLVYRILPSLAGRCCARLQRRRLSRCTCAAVLQYPGESGGRAASGAAILEPERGIVGRRAVRRGRGFHGAVCGRRIPNLEVSAMEAWLLAAHRRGSEIPHVRLDDEVISAADLLAGFLD
jgi:hypothetical protein